MAMILDAFASVFVEDLVSFAKDRISMILRIKDDLEELKNELAFLSNVLADAETKKIRNSAVRVWVSELRELLYDADDLLVDCRVEGERQSSSAAPPQRCSSILRCFGDVSFKTDLGKRIRAIKSELEKLHKKINMLRLVERQRSYTSSVPVHRVAPLLEEEDIVGIDEDARELVDRVVAGSGGKGRRPIFAITGMPGIGKTTLAQKVSNDPQVKTHFEVTIPLCVSKEYNIVDLLKEMWRCVMRKQGKEDAMKAETYNEAAQAVRDLLEDKRLLLVLDDIWEAKVWELLSFAFSSSANGSRVLVTTRNEGVAQEMKAYTHKARMLTEKEGWLMLRRQVFGDDGGEEEVRRLERTGMEIVKKCKSLPLAIKSIAGMLKRRDRTVKEWEIVRDSETWRLDNLGDDIKPSLLLSYEDLPPHLKQCFVYCSLFPEDYRFHHQTLVQMWIAEGLVRQDANRSPEDIGDEYYRELVMRNLLQAAPEYYDAKGCTMHDLMRTLARHVSKWEGASTKLRHLIFVKKETNQAPELVNECLRTILLSKNPQLKSIPEDYFKLKYLRVMDLTHTGIKNLPESLGDLLQLRFLNVAFTKIKRLPESIGKLRNLETLKASDMKNLECLPNGVTRLHKLSFLAVGSAGKPLKSMPEGIGELQGLRTLRGFVVNDGGRLSMRELQNLHDITDLSIYKVDKVEGKEEAEVAKLSQKGSLSFLRLSCTKREKGLLVEEDEKVKIGEVFEGLNPPRRLEALHIDGFFGHSLPTCVKFCSLENLDWLRLDDCKYIEKLPPLGQLPNLRALHIWGATSVSKIEEEFFSTSSDGVSFPKLQEFYLKGMTKLKKVAKVKPGSLPNLKRLQVIKCPKLASLPGGLENAGKLTNLFIEDAESMQSITDLASVAELKLTGNSKLREITGVHALKILAISNCHALEQVECSNELIYLSVSDDRLKALPEWLKKITSVRRINVKGSRELVTRCLLHGSDWNLLEHVPHVEVRTLDGSSYISYRKEPFTFQSNLTGGASADAASSSNCNLEMDVEESTFDSLRFHEEP